MVRKKFQFYFLKITLGLWRSSIKNEGAISVPLSQTTKLVSLRRPFMISNEIKSRRPSITEFKNLKMLKNFLKQRSLVN